MYVGKDATTRGIKYKGRLLETKTCRRGLKTRLAFTNLGTHGTS